jgi:alpha-N-arabinofuranosidase
VIPAASWAGKKVEFSAYVAAEGGATAVLGMLNFVRQQPSNLITVTQASGVAGWVRQSQVYDVPNDPTVQLVITCFVTGTSGSAWFDDVSVVPYREVGGTAPSEDVANARQTPSSNSATALKATVEVDAGTVIRQIPRTLYGTNVEWIWNGNLLWLEESRRAHPDLERLTQELGVSLIRYPGGHYSDFYHWREGIGPYEARPEALHEKGRNDRSRPNFGTDEALDFAQRVNSELLITVNAGSGSAQEAADWVAHANGKSERVRYWEVGNELYMNEGSAMSKSVTVNPTGYAERFREFAQAMRTADSRIKLLAIGGENEGHYANVTYPGWNRTVLETAGDQMDFLAVHNAYAPVLLSGDDKDLRTVYGAMLAAPVLIKRNLETVEQQITKYAPARAAHIGLAVTEWGPLFQFDFRGRYVDHPKTLGSALFVASTLKAFIESPKTEIANFFLLNDVSVLGFIGSRNGRVPPSPDWAPTARYFAFQLFTRHFGEQLVASKAVSPTYDSKAVGMIDAVKEVPYLDIVSSLSPDGSKLYIMAINKHFDSAIEAEVALRGFQPASSGTAWTLTGTGIDANTGTTALQGLLRGKETEDSQNPRFSKGGAGEVALSSSDVGGIKPQFAYRFPPHSVTSLVLSRAK